MKHKTTRYTNINKNIQILLIASSIRYFGEGMLGPLFAIYAERIGGNIFDITRAWATYLIVAGLLYIFVGKELKGSKNKAKIMVIGYALNALFTFSYLFVTDTWHLFFVQIGLAIAAALAAPTRKALYAEHEDKNLDTFEWGLADGFAEIMTGIALLIGGAIVTYYGFTLLFVIMGCIQVLSTLYQAQILWVKEKEK